MAIRQYIGARYVPRFMGTYNPTQLYEVLDVVDNGLGTSYILKKPAPTGTPLTDTDYWFLYGTTSGAIIHLQDQIDEINNIIDSGYVNVISLGVKNDGSENCSDIINANADKPLYFPAGKYKFDSTIVLSGSIRGEGFPRPWKLDHFDGTIFEFTMVDGSNAIEYSGNLNEKSVDIGNFCIQMSYTGTGNGIDLRTTNAHFTIHDVAILNEKGAGIYADPTEAASLYLDVRNVTVWGVYGSPTIGSKGIVCKNNAIDCVFRFCFLLGVQVGYEIHGGNCKIVGGQVWCAGGTNSAAYYNGTICIDLYATGLAISDFYFDSAVNLMHTGPTGKLVTITNCNAYWGAYESLRSFNPPTLFVIANDKTTIYVDNFYIEMPFSAFYMSNRPYNIEGTPIMNGYGDNNTFNFVHSADCRKNGRYSWRIDTADGKYVEIARIGKYASVLANIGNWLMLITSRGPGNAVEYIKIGTGLNVFYKEESAYFSIYAFVPDPYDCIMTGLTMGVINPDYTLLNGERLTYAQQSDTTGLSAATEKQWINP